MLSIVVPVMNEEEAVPVFVARVVPTLEEIGEAWEILFVDDGSRDGTVAAIRAAHDADGRIRLVSLSRNFGKEAALTAGLEWCSGDAAVPMDVDLQDPPEILPAFVAEWRAGYEVVYGKRVAREADTLSKRISAGWFYRIFNSLAATPIEPNAGDFRLMDRAVIDATLELRERNRFMKGIFAWVGFRSTAVPYERPARSAGSSKFQAWGLWNFALDGITGYSTVPLRIWTYVGGVVALGAIALTAVTIGKTLLFGAEVSGYASLMSAILFLGAVQLISLGVIGEYLGRMYHEVKRRPIYILSDTLGWQRGKTDSRAAPGER